MKKLIKHIATKAKSYGGVKGLLKQMLKEFAEEVRFRHDPWREAMKVVVIKVNK